MCIIIGEVVKVSNTNILCSLSEDKKRQLIVYSNLINNTTKNNAMILPVPLPDTIMFHDLSNYQNLFSDCNKCFTKQTKSWNSFNLLSNLKTFSVGSYTVSVAKNIEDLKKFDLSPELLSLLRINYANIFGFIICKLNLGFEKYYPFAYSSEIYNNNIFIPTKHYYKINSINFTTNYFNLIQVTNNIDDNYTNKTGDWNHNIYFYNVYPQKNNLITTMCENNYIWTSKIFDFNKINFLFSKNCYNFEKIKIKGVQENIDLIISVN